MFAISCPNQFIYFASKCRPFTAQFDHPECILTRNIAYIFHDSISSHAHVALFLTKFTSKKYRFTMEKDTMLQNIS